VEGELPLNVDGGLQQRFGYDDEWKFRGRRLCEADWGAIEGLTLPDLRYRGSAGEQMGGREAGLLEHVQGGRLWRFQQVYLTYIRRRSSLGSRSSISEDGKIHRYFQSISHSTSFINNTFTSDQGSRQWLRLGWQLFGMGRLHQSKP
jgi:hypothetical protein